MAETGRVQAVLITTLPGHVIYERFYDRFSDQEKADLRAACASNSPEASGVSVGRFRSGALVGLAEGDLAYYAIGTGEYEELQLSEVLRVVAQSLREALKKAPSEALLFDNYARLCLVVDEVIVEGLVEHSDKDSVVAALRAKARLQSLLYISFDESSCVLEDQTPRILADLRHC